MENMSGGGVLRRDTSGVTVTEGPINAGGVDVWYREAGEGPAVLLLHAGGADSSMWHREIEYLGSDFRAIAFDYPGAGQSPWPTESWAPNDLIAALLSELDVDAAAVIGISIGGAMAIDWAIDQPQRSWALVAVASGPRGIPDIKRDPREKELLDVLDAKDYERAAELLAALTLTARTPQSSDDALRAMIRRNVKMIGQERPGLLRWPEWNAFNRLHEIEVPTLVIFGDEDHPFAQEDAEAMAAGVKHSERVVIDGADHFLPLRAPDAFQSALQSFLIRSKPIQA